MSVYPEYLVLGKDGTIGAYAREDLLKIDLAENFKAGEPARAVFRLEQTLTINYARIHDYDDWVIPLENLCARHKIAALPMPTRGTCVECDAETQEQKRKGVTL